MPDRAIAEDGAQLHLRLLEYLYPAETGHEVGNRLLAYPAGVGMQTTQVKRLPVLLDGLWNEAVLLVLRAPVHPQLWVVGVGSHGLLYQARVPLALSLGLDGVGRVAAVRDAKIGQDHRHERACRIYRRLVDDAVVGHGVETRE